MLTDAYQAKPGPAIDSYIIVGSLLCPTVA